MYIFNGKAYSLSEFHWLRLYGPDFHWLRLYSADFAVTCFIFFVATAR